MEKLDIIMSIIGMGFTFNFGLMALVWTSMNKRMDRIEEKLTDIDRRLCRLEGAFSQKECCMLRDHGHMKKVD